MTSGELSSRPAGGDRHPWDFYVEQPWVTERLCDFVSFEPGILLFDPACGSCNLVQALADRGHLACGTDKFRRTESPYFIGEHDFLGDQFHIVERYRPLSIVTNPPFSCQNGQLVRGLAERFVRKALAIATHKVAALLPVKWLASAGRVRLFTDFPPAIYILGERPSMPPGDRVEQLGKRAFSGGKVDYMWLVWDKQAPRLPYAPTFWIPPRPKAANENPACDACAGGEQR